MYYENLSYFRRIAPALLMTAIFASLFGALYYYAPSEGIAITGLVFLSITLWLGILYIVNEARFSLPRSVRTVIRWLHAMSFEFLIVILAQMVFRPLMRLFGMPASHGAKDGTPILLVHGYLCDWTGWIYVRWKLARMGFGPIYVIDLHNVFGSINDYAHEVAEMANRIKQETNRSDLNLIGHSMGGLVVSTYASQLAPPGRVKNVITIGSPFGGTQMAHIGFIGKSAKEMLPDSEFVKKVQQTMENHPEIRFYQTMSQADELIIPQTSAFADHHLDRHYAVDDIGHMTLLFSSRIANRIGHWLKQPQDQRIAL